MSDENEIQSCKRLLHEMSEMCEGASLTGSLSGGAKRTALRYNAILNRLTECGDLPTGLFSPLPEEVDYSEIGVEARMLAAYFPSNKDKNKHREEGDRGILMRLAPFVGPEELALLVRDQMKKGSGMDMHTLSSLAPFLGQGLLGELLRNHLAGGAPTVEPPQPEPKPSTPEPPASPTPPTKPDFRLEPVSAQTERVEDLLDLLKSPYLSDEERAGAVERLRAATLPAK